MPHTEVLFICTHNSARSQMAEGMVNFFAGDRFLARSAGTEPATVNPLVIRAMKEIGVDISTHESKGLDRLAGREFDYVVTLCDGAARNCPFLPGAGKMVHRGFRDPSAALGGEAEKLAVSGR